MINDKLKIKKELFLKLYILISIAIIIIKCVLSYFDGDVIVDSFIYNFMNFCFGSLYMDINYLSVQIDHVGAPAVLLVVYFSLTFLPYYKQVFNDICKDNIQYKKILMVGVLIVTLFLYFVVSFLMKTILPFSIFEGLILTEIVSIFVK